MQLGKIVDDEDDQSVNDELGSVVECKSDELGDIGEQAEWGPRLVSPVSFPFANRQEGEMVTLDCEGILPDITLEASTAKTISDFSGRVAVQRQQQPRAGAAREGSRRPAG